MQIKIIVAMLAITSAAQAQNIRERFAVWRESNPQTSATLYSDGDTLAEIHVNGSRSAGAEAAVLAVTDAQVTAWQAAQDAPALALAAEITSLESDLTNAVFVAFGVMPPYSANVQANYRATLRTQMQQARAEIAAATTLAQLRTATNTLNQRQGIINIVRELRALKPDWSLSELE